MLHFMVLVMHVIYKHQVVHMEPANYHGHFAERAGGHHIGQALKLLPIF
jgi:hypothetical protein